MSFHCPREVIGTCRLDACSNEDNSTDVPCSRVEYPVKGNDCVLISTSTQTTKELNCHVHKQSVTLTDLLPRRHSQITACIGVTYGNHDFKVSLDVYSIQTLHSSIPRLNPESNSGAVTVCTTLFRRDQTSLHCTGSRA